MAREAGNKNLNADKRGRQSYTYTDTCPRTDVHIAARYWMGLSVGYGRQDDFSAVAVGLGGWVRSGDA